MYDKILKYLDNMFVIRIDRESFVVYHFVLFILMCLLEFFDFDERIILILIMLLSFVFQIQRMNDVGKNARFLLKIYLSYILIMNLIYLNIEVLHIEPMIYCLNNLQTGTGHVADACSDIDNTNWTMVGIAKYISGFFIIYLLSFFLKKGEK